MSSPAGDGEPDGLCDRPGTQAQDAGREDKHRRINLGERQAGRWSEATSPGPRGTKAVSRSRTGDAWVLQRTGACGEPASLLTEVGSSPRYLPPPSHCPRLRSL